jgi:uncharacterized protein YdbL (DUF1318 family)
MMKKISLLFALLAMLCTITPAWADQLGDAKRAGLIGEGSDGYLASVTPNAPAEVAEIISSVNAARKAEYEKIAARNNQPRDVVEKLAAVKLIERTEPGNFVRDASGEWIKK